MSECYKAVCKTWCDQKKKEDRTEASSVRLVRSETDVTRRHQTVRMLGGEVPLDVGFAGSDKKYIMGTL
jgi:hypothetical protein